MAAVVTLQFQDGTVLNAWESFTLRDSYTDPLSPTLDMVARPPRDKVDEYRTKLAKGELVALKVNDIPQGVCLIQTVRITVSPTTGVTFSLRCVSPLITPYQGSVDPSITLHADADAPLLDVILTAMAPYGFSAIIADEKAHVDAITGRPIGNKAAKVNQDALKARDLQAHDDERAYAFCSRLFSRYGVCLRLAWNGELMIGAPDYSQNASYAVVQDSDGGRVGDHFFGDVEIEDSNDDQYSECSVTGARVDTAGDTSTGTPTGKIAATAINPSRPSYASTSAVFKPLKLRDKNARDNARCLSTAKLAMGLRANKAFSVRGTVDGFVAKTGSIWSVDTVCSVYIEAAGVDEDMWIAERELIQDAHDGQRTRLTLLPLNALVLGDLPS